MEWAPPLRPLWRCCTCPGTRSAAASYSSWPSVHTRRYRCPASTEYWIDFCLEFGNAVWIWKIQVRKRRIFLVLKIEHVTWEATCVVLGNNENLLLMVLLVDTLGFDPPGAHIAENIIFSRLSFRRCFSRAIDVNNEVCDLSPCLRRALVDDPVARFALCQKSNSGWFGLISQPEERSRLEQDETARNTRLIPLIRTKTFFFVCFW